MSEKMVYYFGGGKAEGSADMKNLLGGKGANLAEMTNLEIPVPAGFSITTEVCTKYYKSGKKLPAGLKEEVVENMKKVETEMGKKFGDAKNPLLVSVRSGARVSMPGMMDTVLNLGLTEGTIGGVIKMIGDERFAYDSYRRLVHMYGDVVMGVEKDVFRVILDEYQEKAGIKEDVNMTANDWKKVIAGYKAAIKEHAGEEFPEDPWDQLWGAIGAVFGSWNIPRAISYRRINKIPSEWGTAVNVQSMVFGNMGDDSATGVAFTRNPATGDNMFFGEFLINAQGEDVVAGIRTPQPIRISQKTSKKEKSMEEVMPKLYKQLTDIYLKLEKHYRDMQDIEFTIESNKLWMLQTRTGKRQPQAAIKMAVEMTNEGMISKEEALMRVTADQIDGILHPIIDPAAEKTIKVLGKGLPASRGAATGRIVFSAEDAMELQDEWTDHMILIRLETSPDDIEGMNIAKGILTARGGMTSHAALVARGMGKCCIVGCGALNIDYANKEVTIDNKTFGEGDFLTLDGTTGRVIEGKVATIAPEPSKEFVELMSWADEIRRLKVRTNADTPQDAKKAREFNAEGIGLCRTEHMFFKEERIKVVREMIVANTVEEREEALAKLLPMQREDFVGIFRAMDGFPVTIRGLDPPLHEFLPHTEEEIDELAKDLNIYTGTLNAKLTVLHESNPMLGHRGCRLGIAYPEITAMQVRAILEAACIVKKEGVDVLPEIMIPLVGHVNEFKKQKEVTLKVAKKVMKEQGITVDYMVGTMIELPRACLTANEIARTAEFFSFGTNDLTQTALGVSRDDAGRFLPMYVEEGILPADPFQTIDINGVGQLVEMGVKKGRRARKNLKVGICGEHGGDSDSVKFCHKVGLDYVSCSPYRVPIARLAAAQAVIEEKK